jgi:hypothetical protein
MDPLVNAPQAGQGGMSFLDEPSLPHASLVRALVERANTLHGWVMLNLCHR